MEMNKINIEMNQALYLGLSTQDRSRIAMDKYLKPRYGKMAKLCYIDTDSFIPHVKSDDIYAELIRGNKNRFDACNHDSKRPLPIGKNKKDWADER